MQRGKARRRKEEREGMEETEMGNHFKGVGRFLKVLFVLLLFGAGLKPSWKNGNHRKMSRAILKFSTKGNWEVTDL